MIKCEGQQNDGQRFNHQLRHGEIRRAEKGEQYGHGIADDSHRKNRAQARLGMYRGKRRKNHQHRDQCNTHRDRRQIFPTLETARPNKSRPNQHHRGHRRNPDIVAQNAGLKFPGVPSGKL